MGIEFEYSSVDEIPADVSIKDLYSERDGKVVFSGIDGIKTQKDVDSLQEALRKERNDHGQLRESFKAFEGLDVEAARKAIEENEILRLKATETDDKVQELIQSKLTAGFSERDTKIAELSGMVEQFQGKEKLANHTKLINEIAGKHIAEDMQQLVTTNLLNLSEIDLSGEVVTNGQGGYEKGMLISKVVEDMVQKNTRLAKQSTPGHATGNLTPVGKENIFARYKELLNKGNKSRKEQQELRVLAKKLKE